MNDRYSRLVTYLGISFWLEFGIFVGSEFASTDWGRKLLLVYAFIVLIVASIWASIASMKS